MGGILLLAAILYCAFVGIWWLIDKIVKWWNNDDDEPPFNTSKIGYQNG